MAGGRDHRQVSIAWRAVRQPQKRRIAIRQRKPGRSRGMGRGRPDMIVREQVIEKEPEFDFQVIAPRERIIFFDIETTGLSRERSYVYLTGIVVYESGKWLLRQFFSEDFADEQAVIEAFIKELDLRKRLGRVVLITFNGDGFDIPFVRERLKLYSCGRDFMEGAVSLDLYKKVRPYKKLLGLGSCSLKSVERLCGIEREDRYSGGELIYVYEEYLRLGLIEKGMLDDNELNRKLRGRLLDTLLLHNAEDIADMPFLMGVTGYEELFRGNFEVESSSIVRAGAGEERGNAGPESGAVSFREIRKNAESVAESDAVSDAMSDAVAGTVSDVVAGAGSGMVPDAAAGAVPGAVACMVPDAVPGAVACMVSGAVPGAVAGMVSGAAPGTASDAASGTTPGAVPDAAAGTPAKAAPAVWDIRARLSVPLPRGIYREEGAFVISLGEEDHGLINITVSLFEGEARYYFPNYREYYYLPAEDMAVHKSVGAYVVRSARRQATAATCYQRRNGCYVPVPEGFVEEVFRLGRRGGQAYADITKFSEKNNYIIDTNITKRYILAVLDGMTGGSGKRKP